MELVKVRRVHNGQDTGTVEQLGHGIPMLMLYLSYCN